MPKILDVVAVNGRNWQPGPGKYSPRNEFGRNTSPSSTTVARDELFTIPEDKMTKTASKPKTIGKNAPAKIEFFQKK